MRVWQDILSAMTWCLMLNSFCRCPALWEGPRCPENRPSPSLSHPWYPLSAPFDDWSPWLSPLEKTGELGTPLSPHRSLASPLFSFLSAIWYPFLREDDQGGLLILPSEPLLHKPLQGLLVPGGQPKKVWGGGVAEKRPGTRWGGQGAGKE